MKYRFAHRGGGHGEHNTLATFAAALARGAEALETDAWVTADGQVVLDHDGVADHRAKLLIRDVQRADLPGHIPTLAELYDRCGSDFDLAIDIKTHAAAAAVVRVAQQYGAESRLWVVAQLASIAVLAEVEAGHRAVTIYADVLRLPWRRRKAFQAARRYGAEAVNSRWMWWSPRIVRDVHEHGMLAFGYDAQRAWSLNRCLRLGLDGVFSDHVDRMLAIPPR